MLTIVFFLFAMILREELIVCGSKMTESDAIEEKPAYVCWRLIQLIRADRILFNRIFEQ